MYVFGILGMFDICSQTEVQCGTRFSYGCTPNTVYISAVDCVAEVGKGGEDAISDADVEVDFTTNNGMHSGLLHFQ